MTEKLTHHKKILEILIREGGWIPTWAFQDRHGIFIGHRAPARISELEIKYPLMIEARRIDGKRTFEYRFRWENDTKFMLILPDDLAHFVADLMLKYSDKRNEGKSITKPML